MFSLLHVCGGEMTFQFIFLLPHDVSLCPHASATRFLLFAVSQLFVKLC